MGVTLPNQSFELQELVINPFAMHLSDAILAAHVGIFAKSRPEIQAMHYRTSVAHSVFALECAANSFLAQIPRDSPLICNLLEGIDMKGLLVKLNTYLLTRPGNPALPTGDQRVKEVKKLIKLRDEFVHPRVEKHEVHSASSGDGFAIRMNAKERDLILPFSYGWSADDAKSAIGVVLTFLRFYFQLASLSPGEIEITLMTHVTCNDGKHRVDIFNFQQGLGLADTLGLDTSFLFSKPKTVPQ